MLRLLKIVVSAGLITALVWNVEWKEIHSHLDDFNPTLALAATLILVLQYPLSAWKWQQSLRLHGVEYSLIFLLRVLCIAFFFNNFLPTAIGGDAYRAFRTFEHADRPAYSISAIFIERALGLLVLVILGYISVIVLVANGTLPFEQVVILTAIPASVFILLLLIAWQAGLLTAIAKRLRKVKKMEPLMESFRVVRENRQHLWGLVGTSLLFQVAAIGSITLLFSALALPGRIFESGFTAAAAGLAGVIPLSINGIGIVEGSFAVAATVANLPYAQAVVVALFLRFFGLVSSVLFGVLYLLERDANSASGKGNNGK